MAQNHNSRNQHFMWKHWFRQVTFQSGTCWSGWNKENFNGRCPQTLPEEHCRNSRLVLTQMCCYIKGTIMFSSAALPNTLIRIFDVCKITVLLFSAVPEIYCQSPGFLWLGLKSGQRFINARAHQVTIYVTSWNIPWNQVHQLIFS